MAPRAPNYSVCITTARRNQFLRELLASFGTQEWLPAPDAFEVIVVDNNPDGSARPIVEAFGHYPWAVVYRHSPVPNIPAARNTAVDAARCDDLVFVDDDQLLPPDLFRLLEDAWRDQPPSVAAGLFHRRLQFEPGVSIWGRLGGVDPPLKHSHGSLIPPSHGHTGGVVVRRSVLDRVRFDTKWGLMGCDDNAFFKAVGGLGLSVVYLRNVEIIERIQPDRATFKAIVAQGFHQGLCFAHVANQSAGPVAVFVFFVRSLIAFGVYGLALPFDVLLRQRGAIPTLKRFARQIGKLVGVFGFSYDYYAT